METWFVDLFIEAAEDRNGDGEGALSLCPFWHDVLWQEWLKGLENTSALTWEENSFESVEKTVKTVTAADNRWIAVGLLCVWTLS